MGALLGDVWLLEYPLLSPGWTYDLSAVTGSHTDITAHHNTDSLHYCQ